MIGKTPSYSVVLDLETSEWEELRDTLKSFATEKELRFFEDIRRNDSLYMFNVSLCSKDGVWINADKRIWTIGDSPEYSPLPLMIRAQVYKNEEKWASITDRLNSILVNKWPNVLNAEHGYTSSYKNSLY